MRTISKWLWRVLSVAMVFMMALSPLFVSPTAVVAQGDTPPAQPEGVDPRAAQAIQDLKAAGSEALSVEAALDKIDPSLRDAAQAGGEEWLAIYVSVADGGFADLNKFMRQTVYRPAVFAGIRNVYGQAQAGALVDIARQSGVLAVVGTGDVMREKPLASEGAAPDVETLRARAEALKANEVTWDEAQAATGDAGAQGWFDVQDGHKSSTAWQRGFTGDGVIVGILDDGVDFAHPDLQGTYAWVTDPDSPYYGWPMAFSQVSMEYFVNEVYFQNLGALGITSGWNGSRWSDTSVTVSGPTASFEGGGTGTGSYQPIGAGSAFLYTFPATSVSGDYKFGSLHEKNLLAVYGHRVAILVVDEHSAGDYDTVYVDLDNDKDFTDEKPVTQASPEVYRDMDGDGYADVSGGLLAWISDGDNLPPMADWLWGVECGDEVGTLKACPDSGELLIFAGPFDAGYTHGTQCASNVAGQGVVSGGLSAPSFREGGMVQGAAPNVGVMDFGNHYYAGTDEDEFIVAALGYDGVPNSGDEVQITSNSYGSFTQMWGSFGYIGRLITALNMSVAPTTVWVFSSGNEGPGYGPQEGDSSPTTIQAGSSTQYGSTNWDSIVSANQIMYGDPNSFFAKGPSRDSSSGLDILGNGGRGAGDEGLNYFGFDGWNSWDTWGGTSRSSPVVAGNLSLMYEAFKDRWGRWPTWEETKAIIKSSATDSISSPFYQGAGVVNSDRSTSVASGMYGVYAMPDEWRVGDWEGTQYLNFPSVAQPGGTYSQTYTVYNPSGYDITADLSDGVMLKTGEYNYTFTTSDQSEESSFNFHSPDYLMELPSNIIPADAELMVVRYVHPYDTFDPVYDFTATPNSSWRFQLYNWTDVNGDGMLWEDTDANGAVNHVDDVAGGMDNDGFYQVDYADPGTEIQQGEYVRVDYEFGGLAVPIMVHDPADRMADGYFFGFQHRYNDGSIDNTTLTIAVEFYSRADWGWLSLSDASLTVPAEDSATFVAEMNIPIDAETGAYEGVIYLNDPGNSFYMGHESALPVVVNVIADLPDGGSFTLGGGAMADTLYQNSYTNGYFNWYGGGWTGAGDWRHYFFNIDDNDLEKKNLLVHTSWDADYPTDINTFVLGPTPDCASNAAGPCAWYQPGTGQPDPSVFGPYTLWPIAQSDPFQTGATYSFHTSTGGPDDWMIAGLDTAGLHEVALHNVLYDGEKLASQFQVDVGTFEAETSIDPMDGMAYSYPFDTEVYTNTGEIEIEYTSSLGLPGITMTLMGGLVTDDFGPFTEFVPDTGQCYSAWCPGVVYSPFVVDQANPTQLYVLLDMPAAQDADLFLVYDSNDNGVPEQGIDAVVGSSGNSTGTDEQITIGNPALGRYFVAIDGYDVDPDAGVNLDWYYSVTAPGRIPSTPTDLYNMATDIYQDDPFDPTTASFSMTFTADNRTDGLHIMVTDIYTDTDVDVYVTTPAGDMVTAAQTRGDDNEHIYLPVEDLPDVVDIWVHGYDVPAMLEPITPTVHIWEDVRNLWLSSTHPDVTIQAIDPGEVVSATLNFEKTDWIVGGSPISARVIAGPPMLPEAFDELFTLYYVDPPVAGFDPDNLEISYTVDTARGPSPFIRWNVGGPVDTDLGGPSEQAIWTISVTNHDAYTATLDFQAEVDNWSQIFLAGDTTSNNYYVQSFDGITTAPAYGTCAFDAFWVWVEWFVELPPGESATCAFQTTTDPTMLLDHLSVLWEANYFGLVTGADVYNRTFRTTGTEKLAPEVAAPGETFTYSIDLWNPSATDQDMFVYDPLPEEVSFVSATNGASYDAGTHTVTWDGTMAGSSLSPTSIEIEVTLAGDTPEGVTIVNTAYLSDKYFGEPIVTMSASTYVDDGMDPMLSIDKDVDLLRSTTGSVLEYTVTAYNDGTETASAVIVDPVPDMLAVDTASLTGGATYAGGEVMWEGDIPAGGSVSFTFQATIAGDANPGYALINPAMLDAETPHGDVSAFDSALTEVLATVLRYLPMILK